MIISISGCMFWNAYCLIITGSWSWYLKIVIYMYIYIHPFLQVNLQYSECKAKKKICEFPITYDFIIE